MPTILIADDSAVVRQAIRSVLISCPEWVVCGEASDGKEAIQKVGELKPDAILLDLSLPSLSGTEVAKSLGRNQAAPRIILMSQQDPSVLEEIAESVGAAHFIAKSDLATDLPKILLAAHPGTKAATVEM
jgi:DNA-binding NarL/FixJ family response regulator